MKLVTYFLLALMPFGSGAQGLYFPPVTGNTWDTVSPQSLRWCRANIDSLYQFLEANNTKAFILLKDGKIVLEKYFGTHTATTPWYWASAGKTLTAFMVGLAQQENRLNISDKTSDYLGRGWTACTPAQEDRITIRHQLTMTTGLDDRVPDPDCTLDTCLKFRANAGTRWAYHNAPYTLLDGVIEKATGMTLNAYVTQKLRQSTGITGSFLKVGYNNVFFSTARSMARFGLLILNKGVWNGNVIMRDSAYFYQMTHTSQSLNEAYGYLWWLNGSATFMVPQTQIVFNGSMTPNAPADMIAALGKNGQFINVVPSRQLVWIRMGEAPDNVAVPFLLNDQIWRYLNRLECSTVSAHEIPIRTDAVRLQPNPLTDRLRIQSDTEIAAIEVFDIWGRHLQRFKVNANDYQCITTHWPKGLLALNIEFKNGQTLVKIIVKSE